MYSMNGKGNLSIDEASNLEIKPALWISFIICSLCIASSPNTIVIICMFYYSVHITRVKTTIKEDLWLS